MSSTTTRRPSPAAERSRVGQGWAVTACVVLVVLSFVSVMLYVVITQVVLPSRVEVMVGVAVWFHMMVGPVTLLGLAAASLRRLAVSIVAIVVGLAHGAALLVLMFLVVADLSVSASVLSPGTIGLSVVAVALTTAGAVFALFHPSRRLPGTAVIGIVVAAVGSLVSIVGEWITGPLLHGHGATLSISPVSFLPPTAIVLIGLRVAGRAWYLAAVALVALLITAVPPVVGLVGPVTLDLADGLRVWFVLQPTVATVRAVLAAAAAGGLTVSLLRSSLRPPPGSRGRG